MSLLYENHYEQLVNPLPRIDPDSLAEMNVMIYDSVRKDYASMLVGMRTVSVGSGV